MLAASSSPPPPPLPRSTFSNYSTIPAEEAGGDGHSGGLSLLIIVGIVAFVIVASASIHLVLRVLSRSRQSSSSPSSSASPIPPLRRLASSSDPALPPLSDRDWLISSLPMFSLASSLETLKKSSSLDCAVCLCTFRPDDELRLLPACRHAFHAQCVDTWLRSTPSCPLCRSSIHLPAAAPPRLTDSSRSESFRVELGSVSRRRSSADGIPVAAAGHGRSYSLGHSFEYLVEEEVEAVLERLNRAPEGAKEEKPENRGLPAPPGSEVVEASGGGGLGWLRDYVDRLASSASSSFNSLRFSGRIGSHRFDSVSATTVNGGGGGGGLGGRSWDLEANHFVQWEEESGFSAFYRWLVGV
ncbi:E3 ubiquitin-protein ligase ATL4 [Apostasia shenzhenica]|uniref:E3 ubiquitin-protein ligase ATL4 n=1 Tax=Apostasia shenzhenica TaxID=1088818 RepID=A0A2I0ATM1_9ASPA|nr:E3 ubiquitin-protein ligase ATL4 [Apostasia shenzhenica]